MRTLHPELQALLDRMADHLATQKARAVEPKSGVCRYRAEGGLMCAVGCLIPAELYDSDIEGDLAPLFDPENDNTPWQAAGDYLQSLTPSIAVDCLEQFLTLVQAYHDTDFQSGMHSHYARLAAKCNYTIALQDAKPDSLRKRIASDLASLIDQHNEPGWFV
jgi:hypothetical protein